MGSEYQEIKLPSDHRVKRSTYSSIPYPQPEKLSLHGPRQKKSIVSLFLGAFALSLFALFTTRSLKNSNLFQTESLGGNQIIDLIKGIPSTESLHDFYMKYASNPSVAGGLASQELAKWTRDKWLEFGLKNASLETYYPYLNYPKKRALTIVNGEEIIYEASLLESDGTIPTYHAYSASGNVTGPIVYVNYGRAQDFEWLKKKKVHVKGAIALIRHGLVPSSIKLYNAELNGCIGALVFIDPSDIDPIEKKALQETLDDDDVYSWSIPVKRESVEYEFIHPGDPFTPGVAATLNATRLLPNETQSLTHIPSLPISWSDALPLLHATEGHGETKKSWKGGLSQAKYFTGPSKSMVNLVNINDLVMKPVWNVVGQIKGHESDKAIVIGSHRDSLGDCADASSGSAVLLELVRVFGILLEKGWTPRRTIVIASWDAHEYGNTGSTEWVEDHLEWLDKDAVAYINLDNAITGSRFSAEGSPLLDRLIMEVTAMVIDPRTGTSVYETWLSSLSSALNKDDDEDDYLPLVKPLGTTFGLNTLPFFEYAGVSSLSVSFERGGDESDGLWIKEFEDPLFEYHETMVKILGLLVFRLTDDILIPFYPVDYTLAMKHHLKQLTREPTENQLDVFKKENKTSFALPKLAHSLSKLFDTSMKFHEKVQALDSKVVVNKHRSHKLLKHINRANERLVLFERALLNKQGLLKGRPWHKHTVYGPSLQTGLVEPFPAIQEVRALDNSTLLEQVEKSLSHTLKNAKRALKGKHFESYQDNEEEEDDDENVSFVE